MSVITVLGAGFMGAAVTFPLAAVGHEVRLWGTWLDDPLLEACRRGPHPRLHLSLPPAVRLFGADELEPVLERLLPCPTFRPDLPIFSLLHRVLAGGAPCGAELESLVLRYP